MLSRHLAATQEAISLRSFSRQNSTPSKLKDPSGDGKIG